MTVDVTLACTSLPSPHTADCCRQCTCERGYLARYIHANGNTAIRWVCEWCEDYKTAGDLPRSILPNGVTVDDLPLRADNTADSRDYCAICDSPAVDYHHWAPTAIFPDWSHVHGLYLCRDHHTEWHQRMRAQGLRWPHELVDAT